MGFANTSAKPAAVPYRLIVDQFPLSTPLDTISLMAYAAALIGSIAITARRPAYGLGLLIIVAPFAFYRDVLGTTLTLPKIALLGVLVGLTAYPSFARSLREHGVRTVLLAVCAIAGVTLLTLFPAAHKAPVFREFFKVTEHAFLIAAAYAAYRIDRDDTVLLRAFCAALVVVIASALLQEAIGAPSALKLGDLIVPRIAGLLEGPNQLAGYLEIAIATLGAWAIRRSDMKLIALLALCAFTAVLTFSRGGAVGIVIVVATLAAIAPAMWRSVAYPIAGGAAAGVALSSVWMLAAHSFGLLRIEASNDYSGGVGNRGELWQAALRLFRAHPLLGIGAGNYELELADAGVSGVRTHANSWYLQSLAEGGIALFTATIAFVAVTIVTLRNGVDRASPWAAAALAATVALALHQIADDLIFYQEVGTPWMIAIGLGLAAVANARETPCDTR